MGRVQFHIRLTDTQKQRKLLNRIMVSSKILCLLGLLAVGVQSQISFGEEESAEVKQSVEVSAEEPAEEVLSLRYGLLSGYLDLKPVPGTKPIGATKAASTLKANPYVPVKTDISVKQQGNCLCVPVGKCLRPTGGSQQPSVSPTPAPITDGAGIIDIRIVNRPVGVQCQAGFQYCCLDRNVYPPATTPIKNSAPIAQTCGLSNVIPTPSHKIDVTQAKFGEFPWISIILDPANKYIGGGVLVSSRHIITAAHKVAGYQASGLKVRLGEWDAKANIEPLKYVEAVVSRIRIFPLFNGANLQNDIAVLTLDREVDLNANPHINIVCPAQAATNYVNNPRCWVAGWGKDAFGDQGNFQYILKKVNVPIVDSNDCEKRLRQTKLTRFFQLSRTSFICAGGIAGQDACTGDGGFPLVCERNGRAELVGLVAWGIGCANESVPGVYVNVRSYSDWLAAELA